MSVSIIDPVTARLVGVPCVTLTTGAPVSHRRDVILRIRLTAAERAELDRLAEASGLELSDWVRRTLLGSAVAQDGRRIRAKTNLEDEMADWYRDEWHHRGRSVATVVEVDDAWVIGLEGIISKWGDTTTADPIAERAYQRVHGRRYATRGDAMAAWRDAWLRAGGSAAADPPAEP